MTSAAKIIGSETGCRYCRAGNVANERGEHWIVKSIIPAKIDIRKCTRGTEKGAPLPDDEPVM